MGWGDGSSSKRRSKLSGRSLTVAVAKTAKKLTIDLATGKINNLEKVKKLKKSYREHIRRGNCPGCGKTMTKPNHAHTDCAKLICQAAAEDEYRSNTDVDRNPVEQHTADGRNKVNIRWDEPGYMWGNRDD